MNIQTVAEKARVSVATVSRVINKTAKVSKETERRVLAAIKELGYLPNALAKGLRTNNSLKLIGIICTDITDFYYAQAVASFERELRTRGFESLLACTGNDTAVRYKSIDGMLRKNVDAIILVGSVFSEQNNPNIKRAASLLPVFIINGIIDCENTFSVYCDDFSAMSQCCRSLIDSGRRNILYLYDADSFSGRRKADGFKFAADQAAIDYKMLKCKKDTESIEQTVFDALNNDENVDAIAASEDFLAVAALNCAQEAGFSVPERIAVIGYNNSVIAELARPKLTSVDNRIEDICIKAVQELSEVLNGCDVPKSTEIPYRIVKRQTF